MKGTLKNKEEIDNLFKNGKTVSEGIILTKVLESTETKFLFAVSSSKFKRAVDRNKIKRLMRESIKDVSISGKSIAFVFIGSEVPKYELVKSSIDKILNKI